MNLVDGNDLPVTSFCMIRQLSFHRFNEAMGIKLLESAIERHSVGVISFLGGCEALERRQRVKVVEFTILFELGEGFGVDCGK